MPNSNAKTFYILGNQTVDLVTVDDTIRVDNKPMNQSTVVVQKGFTNTVNFFIRNRDRVLQDVSSDTIYLNIINPNTNRRVVFKQLTHVANSTGEVRLDLSIGDLGDLSPGLYKMALTKSADAGVTQYPLSANQNDDMIINLEVKSPLEYHPIETQEKTSFTQIANVALGDSANTFTSSAMYGNQSKNFRHSRHTIAFHLTDFVGNVEIQGSALESVPTLETDWYTINAQGDFGQAVIPYTTAMSGIDPFNFVINTNWIRVKYNLTSGSFDKVQLRN